VGTSHSFPEFQKKIGDAAKNLRAAEKPAVIAGGKVVERTFIATRDAMGAGGTRGASVKNTSTSSNGHPAQSVKFGPNLGWVKIMMGDVKPHWIYPRKFAGTRGKGKRAQKGAAVLGLFGVNAHAGGGLVLPDGGVRRAVFHKGIHKKKPFPEVAQKVAQPLAAKEMQKTVLKEFGKSFK
jgi:hypothetical protein